jgi:hypothetical protein
MLPKCGHALDNASRKQFRFIDLNQSQRILLRSPLVPS